MSMQHIAVHALVSGLVAAAAVGVYHRAIHHGTDRMGVVDVTDVYRMKEKQLIELVSKAGVTEADKKKAIDLANSFAQDLPRALDQLAAECACLVLARTAVAAEKPGMVNLTPALRAKIGM